LGTAVAVPVAKINLMREPGDAGYARVRPTYVRGGSPRLILQPRNTSEVVFRQNLPITPDAKQDTCIIATKMDHR
jgi:hypothetical protein